MRQALVLLILTPVLAGCLGVSDDALDPGAADHSGEEPMPERPMEDAFFALDQEVREALVGVDP